MSTEPERSGKEQLFTNLVPTRSSNAPTWVQLKKLRTARIVSTMYVWLFAVPLAVKALSAVGGPAQLMIFGHAFDVHLSLPFSWPVFYFSALLFTVGNLIYSARCPHIVKDYDSADQFVAQGKTTEQMRFYSADLGWDQGALNRLVEIVNAETTMPERRYHRVFWTVYESAMVARAPWLRAARLAYGAGLVGAGIILLQNLYSVVSYLTRSAT